MSIEEAKTQIIRALLGYNWESQCNYIWDRLPNYPKSYYIKEYATLEPQIQQYGETK